MTRTIAPDVPASPPAAPPGRGGSGGSGGNGGGGRGGGDEWGGSRRASFVGLFVVLAATIMLFAGLTAAYVSRRGVAGWSAAPLPSVLWWNTAVLLTSSGLLEVALHRLKTGRRAAFNSWWTAGAACGVLFLLGQTVAWRELLAAGYYLSGNPASAFFYLLTATHAVHLFAGIAALAYVAVRALRYELGPGRRTAADLGALFWHFLGALWLYLLALFSFWG
jgi:cytochrome c oxidase subunit III